MNKRATDARSMLQGDVSEEAIIDAITDLIHLCSHLNLDWERVTAQAEYHFDQEAAEGSEMNEKYQHYLDGVAKQAQGELESWAVKFAQNPLHQLEWADGVYSAGGKLAAVNALLYYIDTEDFPTACMQTAVNSGRFAKSSSSPTGNLLDAHTRQWIATLAHDINSRGSLR